MSNDVYTSALQILMQNPIFLKQMFEKQIQEIKDSGAIFYVNLGLQLNMMQQSFAVQKEESYGEELNNVRKMFISHLRPQLENLTDIERIKENHMVAFQTLLVQLQMSTMNMFESVFFNSLKFRVDQSKSDIGVLFKILDTIQENMETMEKFLQKWCETNANQKELMQMQKETMNFVSWHQTPELEDWFYKEWDQDELNIPSPEKLATYFLTLLKLFDLKKCLQDIHKLQVSLIDLNRSRLFTEKLRK